MVGAVIFFPILCFYFIKIAHSGAGLDVVAKRKIIITAGNRTPIMERH
jgi:hypothetical protein